MSEYSLKGLSGCNPLAFLAALGTLRMTTLMLAEKKVLMRWSRIEGGWRPTIRVEGDIDVDDWLALLHDTLRSGETQPAFTLAKDLNIPCLEFRSMATAAREKASLENRNHADFVSAFGCEAVESLLNGKKTGLITDTAFRTMSGAGHQHFLGTMHDLVMATDASHLRAALFENWRYDDLGLGLRWDPADDRRYAQRWHNPSGDKVKTVRGANRLAVEALPLLPTAPVGGRLETTGFLQRRGEGAVWSWPIWEKDITLDVIRSLLSLPALHDETPNRRVLGVVGVAEVYRCQRITQGKYRNFSQPVPV